MLDEFKPNEVTNLVSPLKFVTRMLDEWFLKRQIDHAIKVMSRVAPFTKVPYRMSHKELKKPKVQFEKPFVKGYIKPNKSPYGARIFLVHKKNETLKMCVDYRTFNKVIMNN